MLYWVMSGICIFLLAMIPIWTARPDMPSYPFLVLLLLGAIVVAVPLLFRDKRPRRRKSDWAA